MTKQREGLVVNVSHNDLDGIVSAVVHAVAAEHITSVSEEYGKVRNAVRFSAGAGRVAPLLRDLAELGVQVVVTDIFLSKDEFAIIDAVEPVIPKFRCWWTITAGPISTNTGPGRWCPHPPAGR